MQNNDGQRATRGVQISQYWKQSVGKPYKAFQVPIKARRYSPEEIENPIKNNKFVSKQLNEKMRTENDLVDVDSESKRKRCITMCGWRRVWCEEVAQRVINGREGVV